MIRPGKVHSIISKEHTMTSCIFKALLKHHFKWQQSLLELWRKCSVTFSFCLHTNLIFFIASSSWQPCLVFTSRFSCVPTNICWGPLHMGRFQVVSLSLLQVHMKSAAEPIWTSRLVFKHMNTDDMFYERWLYYPLRTSLTALSASQPPSSPLLSSTSEQKLLWVPRNSQQRGGQGDWVVRWGCSGGWSAVDLPLLMERSKRQCVWVGDGSWEGGVGSGAGPSHINEWPAVMATSCRSKS